MLAELGIVIPAAGASRRMRGRDKLTEPVGGVPLLRRQVEMAGTTGLPILVTLRADRPARRAALASLPGLSLLDVEDPDQGMSVSLRAAANWAIEQELSGLMIVLGDMPDLRTSDIYELAMEFAEHPDSILRATDESGVPGHPVVLPARLFEQLQQVSGDDGGRSVMAGDIVHLYPLPDLRATTDLDTPEDWARWRENNPETGR